MDVLYLLIIIGFVVCLTLSFALLAKGGVETLQPSRFLKPQYLPFQLYAVFAIISALCATLYNDYYDFVSSTNLISFCAPLLGGFALIASLILIPQKWGNYIAQFIIIGILVFLFEPYTINFSNILPSWSNKILTILLWFALANSITVLINVEALAETEMISVSLGMFALYFISGGLPALLGATAIFFTGIILPLFIYRWYPPKISLPRQTYSILGYAFSWLMIFGSAEFSGSCIYIFAVVLILENIIAYTKKLTFVKKYTNPSSNTVTYQTNLSGLSPDIICRYIFRINFLFIIIGCFQYYAPDSYSIPLLASLICCWNLYRLYNWNTLPNNLKESKQQIVSDLKKSIEKVKNNLNGEQ